MHFLNKSTMLATVIAVLCGLISLGGCGKKPSDGATDQTQGAASDGNAKTASASDASDAPDTTSPLAPQAYDQLKDIWSMQIDGVATQADTLKKAAAEHPDAELNSILANLDAKIADTKKLFSTVTPANGSKVLQVDIPKMMAETSTLVAKASGRVLVIVNAAAINPKGSGVDGAAPSPASGAQP